MSVLWCFKKDLVNNLVCLVVIDTIPDIVLGDLINARCEMVGAQHHDLFGGSLTCFPSVLNTLPDLCKIN